jgi:hypothetical protein
LGILYYQLNQKFHLNKKDLNIKVDEFDERKERVDKFLMNLYSKRNKNIEKFVNGF